MLKIKGKDGVVYGIDEIKFEELKACGVIFPVKNENDLNKLRNRILRFINDENCISYGLLRNKLRCGEAEFKREINKLKNDGIVDIIERKNKYRNTSYFDVVIK